jgi:ribosomal protein S18 acetylase RimI-like enzyme
MDRKIKILSSDELEDVVKIHMAALPDDVLPNLGRGILIDYYKGLLADKSQHLFGVVSDKQVLGFCLLSIGQVGLWRLLLNFRGVFSLAFLVILKTKIFYSGVIQAIKTLPLNSGEAEVSFIAVAPAYQGMGLGKLLLDHALRICKVENIKAIKTKTSNQQLKDFYLRKYEAVEVDRFSVNRRCYYLLTWSTGFMDV